MVTLGDLNLIVYKNRPIKMLETPVNQALFFKTLKNFLAIFGLAMYTFTQFIEDERTKYWVLTIDLSSSIYIFTDDIYCENRV